MDETQPLEEIGVTGEWIWGDDGERVVFAQAFGEQKTLIFRFTLDENAGLHSLPNRIVTCFHDIETEDVRATFSDRAAMRTQIWAAVAQAWLGCRDNPKARELDVIIDIYAGDSSASTQVVSWKLHHDQLFKDYVGLLQPLAKLAVRQSIETVGLKSLVRLEQLGGRGNTTRVYVSDDPNHLFVFKGIDFRTFLAQYEDGYIQTEVRNFYRATELLSNMPPHPNIMTPAETLVTIDVPDNHQQVVCGSLYSFVPNGNLSDQIQNSYKTGIRLKLPEIVKWCCEMVAAVHHTHRVAQTYHMDIKPGNFLLDKNNSLVLIDWEQSDAPVTTAAPEIDGTWDAKEVQGPGDTSILEYTKYTGPERRNMPDTTPGNMGWHTWNVFLEWSKTCPKALELAEVFSLARTMWMLLRQPDMDSFEDVESTEDVIEDWNSCEDIPSAWKEIVQRCLDHDPNKRMTLGELLTFWNKERGKLDAVENISD